MRKEEILFKEGIKIQSPNRVNIPKELLKNVGLEENDQVILYYDYIRKVIIITGDKK
jgi:bifunctional DNA-binding transcriptional regulator/antitoxin component of YhaV-PrlF toxin-antitoxin module